MRMASSSPPPLVPIHGPDRIHRTIVKQSVGNQEMESQFGTSFNGGHYGVNEEVTDSYNQLYNKDSFSRKEDLTTQSHMKIEGLELRTLTRVNQKKETGVLPSEFTTDSLCDHFNQSQSNNLQEERTLDIPKIMADIDCYWYRKNIENAETINCLKNEVQRLRKKLIAVESIRAVATPFSPTEFKKKDGNFQDIFKCEHCKKKYKTERGLQFHLTRNHINNQTHHKFTTTVTDRPDARRKQSDDYQNGRYYNNGLPIMSPQASLILFPDVPHPSVSSL